MIIEDDTAVGRLSQMAASITMRVHEDLVEVGMTSEKDIMSMAALITCAMIEAASRGGLTSVIANLNR